MGGVGGGGLRLGSGGGLLLGIGLEIIKKNKSGGEKGEHLAAGRPPQTTPQP